MNYLSVCSGIEAATVAWHPLGWKPVAFGEIEKFPSQVLAHHYPDTPNWGDMTKFKEWPNADVNVFVGGTPCQSFSVAGLRKGLDDPRGNLMLTYLAIAAKYRPQWLVWENVPGVLSSNGGLDFASLLRGMGELGYGFAYRILDAQYFGVAQRRRRVFVVGYLGNWRPAAAVLFERHSLSGHPAPSRQKGKTIAPSIGTGALFSSTGNERVEAQAMIVTGSLCARTGQSNSVQDAEQGHLLAQPIPIDSMNHISRPDHHSMGDFEPGASMYTLTKQHHHAVAQPIAFSGQMSNPQTDVDMTQTLQAKNPMAVAVGFDSYNLCETGDVNQTLKSPSGGVTESIGAVMQAMAVRRLTPMECERLQGFPDNYTDIKHNGKPTPDGPRYKALGNSMAVPVMHWIGSRIQQVQEIL